MKKHTFEVSSFVHVVYKMSLPYCSRSSFCGTARSRHPVGANGLPCPSPSLWQTAGGRWGPMPLATHTLWLTSEWQRDKLSVDQSVCVSLSFTPSVPLFLWSFSLVCNFLCLSSYPCTSDMSTDPCGVCFHKCHSFLTFILRLPLVVCLFWTPEEKSIVKSAISVTQHDLL